MAENTPTAEMQTIAEPAAEPRTFTQEEVSSLCAREAGKAERTILKQFGLNSKDGISDLLTQMQASAGAAAALQTATTERDDYKAKYESAFAELTSLKNVAELSKYGVTDAEDAEFYVYKIAKMTGKNKTFAEAAAEYFGEHPINRARVSLMHESGGATTSNTLNERMNRMLRGE